MPRSKNDWSYTSTPQYAFIAWYSVKAQGLYPYLYDIYFSIGIERISVISREVTGIPGLKSH
jgi:hypothetical protein